MRISLSGKPKRGIKIRGVDGSKEESIKRCKDLQSYDKYFHVFSGEVGKWLPYAQNPTTIEDQKYYREVAENSIILPVTYYEKGFKQRLPKFIENILK